MQISAAIVPKKGAPFQLANVELNEPAADELIVRVVASGICQTDLHGRDSYYGTPFPCVFGHEGAGVVERVGRAVRKVAPGDHVLMVSPGCGTCAPCASGRPGYCFDGRQIKMSGLLRSGQPPMRWQGAALYGGFFQQSSFATYSLATEQNVVKAPPEMPLAELAALPCGVNTGAGAVMNILRPRRGQSFALFGAGTVGLAGLMLARHAGSDPIIAVDLHPHRLALARELGATHCIDATATDAVSAIRALTGRGAELVLEAAGEPRAFRQAVDALAPLGTCCLAGSARPGTEVALEMSHVQYGRTVRGCIQGDAPPDEFFPKLFALYAAGELPVGRLITYYEFAEINQAVADMASGKTIKAVLRIGTI